MALFRTSRISILALAGLFVAGVASAQAPAGVKLAVIDVQRIVTDSQPGKATMERLRKLSEEKENQAKTRQTEITNLQDQISKGRLSLAEEKLTQLNKELEDKAIAYRRFQDDATRELNKAREDALGEIERRVLPIIDQVGKELGFTLVFNKFQSGLVYADPAVDITDRIIERFNAAQPK